LQQKTNKGEDASQTGKDKQSGTQTGQDSFQSRAWKLQPSGIRTDNINFFFQPCDASRTVFFYKRRRANEVGEILISHISEPRSDSFSRSLHRQL